MKYSVIIPTLNEEKYLQPLLEFLLKNLSSDAEVLFIDGGSTDRTLEVLVQLVSEQSNYHLYHNKRKFVAFALNLAIPNCKGDFIIRLDAHTHYADDYFDRIIAAFSKSNAEIVGGPTRTQFDSPTQEAVAFSISHPLGIGGSKVHDENYEGYSDSVTFGAWRREIFTTTGLFDERLVRNQDDEFHYRAKSKGFKIFQDPAIKLYYSPRDNFKGLFKQYFQYGLYKPMVLKKIKSEIKSRHLIPSFFVLYLVTLFLFMSYPIVYIPLVLYLILITYVAFFSTKRFTVKIRIFMTIPCIHIAYGSGFLLGILKIFKA